VTYLMERCQPPTAVVVPLWEGRLQPLHAVYRADTAPILKQLLAAGSEVERERIRTRLRDAEWWAVHIINSPGSYSVDGA